MTSFILSTIVVPELIVWYIIVHVVCCFLNIFLLTKDFVNKRPSKMRRLPFGYIFLGPFWTLYYIFG